MSVPTTPQKKRGGLNDVLISLNVRWGFDLPVHSAPESPSKLGSRGSTGSKVANRIAFLFFKNRVSLHEALESFDRYADSIFSKWVFKPYGDVDTVPHRAPLLRGNRGHAFPLDRALSADETASLLESLLRFLNDTKDTYIVSSSPRANIRPDSTSAPAFLDFEAYSTNLSYHDNMPPNTKQTSIANFFRGRAHEPSALVSRQDPTSSQDFGSWPDAEDIAMLDDTNVQSDTLSTSESTENEDFGTPPEQPSDDLTLRVKSQCFKAATEHVPIVRQATSLEGSKKRPSNGDGGPSARKACRGDSLASKTCSYPVLQYDAVQGNRSNTTSASTSFTSNATTKGSLLPTTANTSFGSMDQRPLAASASAKNGNANISKRMSSVSIQEAETFPHELLEVPGAHRGEALAPTNATIKGVPVQEYFASHLHGSKSPFAEPHATHHHNLDFRLIYEVTRAAYHTSMPPQNFFDELSCHRALNLSDLSDIYSTLSTHLSRASSSKRLPARSPLAAWNRAQGSFEEIVLSGDLCFSEDASDPMLRVQLKPLKIARSYRWARKWPSDRYMIIGLPGLEPNALPKHLGGHSDLLKSEITSWLVHGNHTFLGRTWKALWMESVDASTKTQKEKRGNMNAISHHVYLFAADGAGFGPMHSLGHRPVSRSSVLTWFMPFKRNGEQPALKLFSRLKLAVSSTRATLEFQIWQIIRCDDQYSSEKPGPRRLNTARSDEKKVGKASLSGFAKSGEVMNDGCARISYQAAVHISDMLGLDYIPSAFQGRIAGAKGLWLVDYTREMIPRNQREEDLPIAKRDPGVWIEITDSQLKFESSETDSDGIAWHDKLRKTFEVNAYSKPLTQAKLNFQLMAILTEQGIPKSVFEKLLREDLTTVTSHLKAAMNNPVALRVWNHETAPVATRRIAAGGVEWLGGFPDDSAEQINCLIEHGFEPKECKRLNELCYESIKNYSHRLSDRMHITLGRSTNAFMLADPLGVLDEDEIHLGFSSCFQDAKSGFADTMVTGVDVLVARMPAALPSDIQKVRAVFKTELARYKDVIIFPVKGKIPLAAKLSGGDYDGDKAWVCWEPTMVEPFHHHDLPPQRQPRYYGITKNETKVRDIVHNNGNEADLARFLEMGFEFALRQPLLGIVTNYHGALVYDLHRFGSRCVRDPRAIDIGMLAGLLVDAPKNGFNFGFPEWKQFKARQGLRDDLPRPAFLGKGENKSNRDVTRPNFNHVVDYLSFHVTDQVIKEELGDFMNQYQQDATTWDPDLAVVLKEEEKIMRESQPELKLVLDDLKKQIDGLHEFWKGNVPAPDNEKRSSTFAVRVEELRSRFLAIKPLQHPTTTSARWSTNCLGSSAVTARHWELLKASTAATRRNSGKFIWYACGREVCELKATQVGARSDNKESQTGGSRLMVKNIHDVLRPDGRMVKRMEERNAQQGIEAAADEEDDEEYGYVSDGYYSVLSDMGYFR